MKNKDKNVKVELVKDWTDYYRKGHTILVDESTGRMLCDSKTAKKRIGKRVVNDQLTLLDEWRKNATEED